MRRVVGIQRLLVLFKIQTIDTAGEEEIHTTIHFLHGEAAKKLHLALETKEETEN